MRVLVHGASLGPAHERLRQAAAALGGRGHVVHWLGPGAPEDAADLVAVRGLGAITRARADVVIGGDAPHAMALTAWLSGAGAMLVGLDAPGRPRWNTVDRWFLGSVRCAAIAARAVEEAGEVGADVEHGDVHGWPEGEAAPGPDPVHPDAERLERVCEGLRSRRHGPSARPAAFIDRDGTLVIERGYLARAEDIELLPSVPRALRALQAAGFALIVVSNQSGIGRGLFPRSSVIAAMARLRREVRRHGVELDGVYFCPHRPDEGCPCRKPSPGMLRQAAAEHGLDPKVSAMIGDKLLDAATGHAAGGFGILVETGYGRDEAQRAATSEYGRPPDFVAADLAGAADWLIARDGQPATPRVKKAAVPRSGRGWTLTPLGGGR